MTNSPFAATAAAATASQAGGNSVIETKKALQATAQGRGKTIDFRTAGVGEYVQLLSKTPAELAAFVKAQLRTDINQPGSSLIQLNKNLPEGVLAATGDGKIFVSPGLMDKITADDAIREEIAEIIYQTLFDSTSQGDFGAEVVLRLNSPDGRVSPQDIKNLRAENDTFNLHTRTGIKTVEAIGVGSVSGASDFQKMLERHKSRAQAFTQTLETIDEGIESVIEAIDGSGPITAAGISAVATGLSGGSSIAGAGGATATLSSLMGAGTGTAHTSQLGSGLIAKT